MVVTSTRILVAFEDRSARVTNRTAHARQEWLRPGDASTASPPGSQQARWSSAGIASIKMSKSDGGSSLSIAAKPARRIVSDSSSIARPASVISTSTARKSAGSRERFTRPLFSRRRTATVVVGVRTRSCAARQLIRTGPSVNSVTKVVICAKVRSPVVLLGSPRRSIWNNLDRERYNPSAKCMFAASVASACAMSREFNSNIGVSSYRALSSLWCDDCPCLASLSGAGTPTMRPGVGGAAHLNVIDLDLSLGRRKAMASGGDLCRCRCARAALAALCLTVHELCWVTVYYGMRSTSYLIAKPQLIPAMNFDR